ncbi:MAG: hypothetical protein J0I65_11095, partial [Variovorax sp.]|nr:hypothetical protein [Variovorax sp.]
MRALRSLRVVPIWLMRSASMVVSCSVVRGVPEREGHAVGAEASGENPRFSHVGLALPGGKFLAGPRAVESAIGLQRLLAGRWRRNRHVCYFLLFTGFGFLMGAIPALLVVRPARPAGALAAAAGLRSPALARADRLVVRAVCSLSIDVLEGLHGAANGACA